MATPRARGRPNAAAPTRLEVGTDSGSRSTEASAKIPTGGVDDKADTLRHISEPLAELLAELVARAGLSEADG